MRITALLLTSFCLLACTTTAPAQPEEPQPTQPKTSQTSASSDADAWLQRITDRADELDTLTATVRYDRIQSLLGDRQRRFGALKYAAATDEQPPQFSIHFDRLMLGEQQRRIDQWFIFDGRWLLERDHDEMTAIRRELVPPDTDNNDARLMELGEGPFALPLDMDPQAVRQRFEVALIPPAEDDPDNSIRLRLTPRPEMADRINQEQIDLWYDRETLLPIRVVTDESDESRTVIQLLRSEINPELEDASFDTSLPTGNQWQTQTVPLRTQPN